MEKTQHTYRRFISEVSRDTHIQGAGAPLLPSDGVGESAEKHLRGPETGRAPSQFPLQLYNCTPSPVRTPSSHAAWRWVCAQVQAHCSTVGQCEGLKAPGQVHAGQHVQPAPSSKQERGGRGSHRDSPQKQAPVDGTGRSLPRLQPQRTSARPPSQQLVWAGLLCQKQLRLFVHLIPPLFPPSGGGTLQVSAPPCRRGHPAQGHAQKREKGPGPCPELQLSSSHRHTCVQSEEGLGVGTPPPELGQSRGCQPGQRLSCSLQNTLMAYMCN